MKRAEKRILLSTPTMHAEEMGYITEAFDKNWIAPLGFNCDGIEKEIAEYVSAETDEMYTLALVSGTAALHLAVKLAGVKPGDVVLCSDMTFSATVNPIVYEGGVPVFVDSERETWNMDPVALEKAFEKYPNAKAVMLAHLYGTPSKMKEIIAICKKYGAALIEDAAEALSSTYFGKKCGTFGEYNVISFNGNKIITTSGGGMLLTGSREARDKAFFWSTQSRENTIWYEHKEIGYNYRMSNVLAGIGRGQLKHLEEHRDLKEKIYQRYKEGFKDLPVTMNPYDENIMEPNFWLSCLLINEDAMCKQVRSDNEACYVKEKGKTCPTEILETLAKYNAEGRPIWKPMHMQPLYRMNPFVTVEGNGRGRTNAYIAGKGIDVGADIFARGLCLPSDNKMTVEEQDKIIAIIRSCFE